MIDNYFRDILPKYLDLILRLFRFLRFSPNQITVIGFLIAVGAVYLVFKEYFLLAILVWWLSRLLDACDGIYARKYDLSTYFGAYLDIQLDMLAYSLMIIAMSQVFPSYQLQWFLILMGYVLCITGALSLGSFENKLKRKDKSRRGLRLALGLAEGGETGIFYTIFLLFSSWLGITTWIWVGFLYITVVARLFQAHLELKEKRDV